MTVDADPSDGAHAIIAEHTCAHCGVEMSVGSRDAYCCIGCRVVSGLLSSRGLQRYYDLRGERGAPVASQRARRDLKWLDAIELDLQQSTGARCVELDLQGIQCAACVWLQEELFKRHTGDGAGLDITVNPALGKVELLVKPGFDLRRYIEDVEQFGYLFGPAVKRPQPNTSALLGRIGLAMALALNAMLFSIPIYFGLRDGLVHTVFRWLAFLLATASVAVGARCSCARRGRACAAGCCTSTCPSRWARCWPTSGRAGHFFAGRDEGAYFDTVTTFIALMLVGRWLQERVLDRNRAAPRRRRHRRACSRAAWTTGACGCRPAPRSSRATRAGHRAG
jgi:Cu2+-exporting ATPase